jgi:hypothetical protein
MDAAVLAGVGVGGSRDCDDRVCLPHNALVSTLAGPGQGPASTKAATFTQALYDEAIKKGWVVIGMKSNWQQIFTFEP